MGPYEVAEQIGVGGMGEVYRGTNTNLVLDWFTELEERVPAP